MRTLRRLLLCLITLYVLGAAAPLLAQGGRAEINGTVTDAQKAVLPGVTVTVTNEETGLMREAVTDGTGLRHPATAARALHDQGGSLRLPADDSQQHGREGR